ncbi:MAG: hypothetical protein ACJ8IQ_07120 [Chthoniobacterales bacterium]|jgi:hypothetical protein
MMSGTTLTVWLICALLALGVGWSRYEKRKTRDKILRELIAMDPKRRETVLNRLNPKLAMELREDLLERYQIT